MKKQTFTWPPIYKVCFNRLQATIFTHRIFNAIPKYISASDNIKNKREKICVQ